MADEAKKTTLLSSFYGTVDQASVEEKQDRSDKTYLVANLAATGIEKTVTLYVRGKTMEDFKAKVAAGEEIFVQGEVLAKGTGLSVSNLAPKTYKGKIEKLNANGTNDYGDWASIKMSFEGDMKDKQVMLSGPDAAAAVEAGEGGSISFEGAWKPEQNEESKTWYSRLVSASSRRGAVAAPQEEAASAPEM